MIKRLVVFSHYDADNVVDEYVLYYLSALQKIVSNIIFVSTSKLNNLEKNKLFSITSKVICRENIGYDFMSYKIGLLHADFDKLQYDEVIFCNDSTFGPIFDLLKMFKVMENKKFDFWGITKSKEIKYHIQSYFLVFSKKVISSLVFQNFLDSIENFNSKEKVIQHCEIGLTSLLKDHFTHGTYLKYPSIFDAFKVVNFYVRQRGFTLYKKHNFLISNIRRFLRISRYFIRYTNQFVINKNKMNPTLYFYEYGFKNKNPFIKRHLLRGTIIQNTDNEYIYKRIQFYSDYNCDIIKNNLKRLEPHDKKIQ